MHEHLTLGSGLVRLGREWGVPPKPVPSEQEAFNFLQAAYTLGIRFFDTAPSYGTSEQRLGTFLTSLSPTDRNSLTIATKFGEHWNEDTQQPYVDHTYDGLMRSLEQSLQRLGTIDILQLHKSTVALLENPEVARAFAQALTMGVAALGVSVSDVETGLAASQDERFLYLQLPYNRESTHLQPVVDEAIRHQKRILFNRPFAMGAIAQHADATEKHQQLVAAYRFIARTGAEGVILSGTASAAHLEENLTSFNEATETPS